MPRILFSASFPETLLARQLPGDGRYWDEFEFLFEPDGRPVDAWVVYDNLREPLTQMCPRGNTLFISGEPQSLRTYRSGFTQQFAQVWTSHTNIRHPCLFRRNEAQPWHYGLYAGRSHGQPLAYDALRALPRPERKPGLISVLCSSKQTTQDHRQRQEFTRQLADSFGSQVDVFGRGRREIADKSDAIWPYKYHVVLENDHTGHFMTEKLADTFLGWSYPIYFGGSEAYHRYPQGSFTAIDIYQPEAAIDTIRQILEGDTYERSLDLLAAARTRVLDENNLVAMLVAHFREQLREEPCQRLTLVPKSRHARLWAGRVERWFRYPRMRSAA